MELNGQLHTLATSRPDKDPALPLSASLGAGLGEIVKKPVVLPSWMDVRFCRRPACSAVTLLACLLSYKCTFQYLFKKLLFFWRNSPPLVQGLLIHEVSRLHTMTQHSQYDSYGRVMGSSQKPLPDNTHHSQQTDFHAPVGFEPTISAGERPQTYALDRAATGTGKYYSTCNKKKVNIETSKTRQFNNDNNNT